MALEYQIIIALILDFLLGDPKWFPHPVRFVGNLAIFMENLIRKAVGNGKFAGFLCAVLVIGLTGMAIKALLWIGFTLSNTVGEIVSIILIYFGIAARDMIAHSARVYIELIHGNTEAARLRVAEICGRDTDPLDNEQLTKATIESVSENTVDGVVAPLFFAFLGGPIAMWMYKAASTLDSTFGYKNERYINFGWFAAKLDDVLAFVPARLAGLFLVSAGWLIGADSSRAFRILLRDRKKHPSPNSAHGEAAVAGILGIQLGGPSFYSGVASAKPQIGDPINQVVPSQILTANALLVLSSVIAVVVFSALRIAA